ncbi:protein serine/threonine phosphatase 2C [Calocera cornea HHB12733]|uniref:Protein serine/threonine phosphatase 2C n=1 Tax=Calocera cornea HHB12733 TaxID=1353952 RepID=A0A165INE3_9BASI|nr:protein serine/threonine phosphatase 2C [Calocera cornea HHB12733]
MSQEDTPDTRKFSRRDANVRVVAASSTMRGYREKQEDRFAVCLELPVPGSSINQEVMFFGVYDGHRGFTMAQHVATTLHSVLAASDAYKKALYRDALDVSFRAMDQDVLDGRVLSAEAEEEDKNYPNAPGEPTSSGCTATVALIIGKRIIVANAGDSRAVICRSGKAIQLSTDHSPFKPSELERIHAAGSKVIKGKVGFMLAMSRSLGDIGAKSTEGLTPEQQPIIGIPDLQETTLTADDEFMVLASDGVWTALLDRDQVSRSFLKSLASEDLEKLMTGMGKLPEKTTGTAKETLDKMVTGFTNADIRRAISSLGEVNQYKLYEAGEKSSSQNVCDVVRWCIAQKLPLDKVCECVLDFCFANFNGNDNMTIVVVAFLNGRTFNGWQTWVATRERREYGRKGRVFEAFEPRPDKPATLNEIVAQALRAR